MEVRLLGPFDVVGPRGRVALRGPRQRALVAILAVHRGEAVSVDRLVEWLWEDGLPAHPANALQAQVSSVRRALAPDRPLATREPGYALELGPDDVDASRFERLAAEGRRRLDDGDAAHASATLADALGLWRGPALVDFEYAGFAQPAVARLEDARLTAVEARVDADLLLGRHAALAGELDVLCATHPLRERFWAQRMLALYRCGRQADALRVFGDARRGLVDAAGVEPGPELRRLEALVLAQDPALDEASSAVRPGSGRGNVPARLTRFVGRRADVAAVRAALARDRLVTLVGTGGAGKTRLALEVADEMATAVADGAWLVELAPLGRGDDVCTAIAAALGLADAREAAITESLRGRSMLLVLDNCEHVVAHASAVVERLLGSCRGLRVLATSREALGVPGEVVVLVGPLPADDAMALFVERAAGVGVAVDVADERARVQAGEVCTQVDGLPLAIELAAARLRTLPLADVVKRLDDRFGLLSRGPRTALPRQQTLRAVVDWSHELLVPDQQRCFARLSVFAGGWTLGAAEAIVGADPLTGAAPLELLTALVERSLVGVDRTGDTVRYGMLETLRQYARERLEVVDDGAGSGEVRDGHARWYRDLAVAAEHGLRGPEGQSWRATVVRELENIRVAFDRALEHGVPADALAIVNGICWVWMLDGNGADAVRWLDAALAGTGRDDAIRRARAEAWRAYFAGFEDAPGNHVERCERAVRALSQSGDDEAYAGALLLLAVVLERSGRHAEGLAPLALASPLIDRIGWAWGAATRDMTEANLRLALGELDEAERIARRSAERFRAVGEQWLVVEVIAALGTVADIRGDTAEALALYEENAQRARQSSLPGYLASALLRLARMRLVVGDAEGADALCIEALASSRVLLIDANALALRGRVARRLGDLERARRHAHEARATFELAGSVPGVVSSHVSLAWIAFDARDRDGCRASADAAARAFGASTDHDLCAMVDASAALAAVLEGDPATASRLLRAPPPSASVVAPVPYDEADVARVEAMPIVSR